MSHVRGPILVDQCLDALRPVKSNGPTIIVTCEQKTSILTVESLVGRYVDSGRHNDGQKVFRKEGTSDPGQVGREAVFLYYWGLQDGPEQNGWWFGNDVGGSMVWCYAKGRVYPPPMSGWRVPIEGEPSAGLKVLLEAPWSAVRAASPAEPVVLQGPKGRQLQAAEQSKKCPNGHNLQRYLNDKGTLNACNACSRTIRPPEHLYRCSACNFDHCTTCYHGQPVQAPAAATNTQPPTRYTNGADVLRHPGESASDDEDESEQEAAEPPEQMAPGSTSASLNEVTPFNVWRKRAPVEPSQASSELESPPRKKVKIEPKAKANLAVPKVTVSKAAVLKARPLAAPPTGTSCSSSAPPGWLRPRIPAPAAFGPRPPHRPPSAEVLQQHAPVLPRAPEAVPPQRPPVKPRPPIPPRQDGARQDGTTLAGLMLFAGREKPKTKSYEEFTFPKATRSPADGKELRWTCGTCEEVNKATRSNCNNCGQERREEWKLEEPKRQKRQDAQESQDAEESDEEHGQFLNLLRSPESDENDDDDWGTWMQPKAPSRPPPPWKMDRRQLSESALNAQPQTPPCEDSDDEGRLEESDDGNRSEDFEQALADHFCGQWMTKNAKSQQWHEIKEAKGGSWLCQTWTDGKESRTTRIAEKDGEVLWGKGQVKLDRASFTSTRMIWVWEAKTTRWEWKRGWEKS